MKGHATWAAPSSAMTPCGTRCRQASGDRRQATGDRRQATGDNDRRQASVDRRQASGIRRQATGDRRQASGIRRQDPLTPDPRPLTPEPPGRSRTSLSRPALNAVKGQASAATARGNRRCSRSSRASPSRRAAAPRPSAAGSPACWTPSTSDRRSALRTRLRGAPARKATPTLRRCFA